MERRGDQLPEELTAAAAEMIPVIGPIAGLFTKRSVAKIREEHARRVSIALRAAERLSGMTREELGDAIAEDPRLVPLVTRVLYAAGMNGHDRTLAAMGTALGDAVRDRDRLGEVELILAALADLGAEHVILLGVLGGAGTGSTADRLIIGNSALSHRVFRLCLAGLISRGLVTSRTGRSFNVHYDITELGRVVLEVLAELETDSDR
jgi:predicted transcriptional regulator